MTTIDYIRELGYTVYAYDGKYGVLTYEQSKQIWFEVFEGDHLIVSGNRVDIEKWYSSKVIVKQVVGHMIEYQNTTLVLKKLRESLHMEMILAQAGFAFGREAAFRDAIKILDKIELESTEDKTLTTIKQAVEQGKLNPVFGKDAENLGYRYLDSYLDEECK